jgi:hypothetical protein
MTDAAVTDGDKIVISKFWKSRSRGEHVVVSLKNWNNLKLVDVRVYADDEKGCSRPTAKGVSIVAGRICELQDALRKAVAKAVDLGWLTPQREED